MCCWCALENRYYDKNPNLPRESLLYDNIPLLLHLKDLCVIGMPERIAIMAENQIV